MSEVFFESPQVLKSTYTKVYQQLSRFYRQDPALRMIR
ncbi:MAG: zinc-dependent peptidase [Burkholderiales bacterium]